MPQLLKQSLARCKQVEAQVSAMFTRLDHSSQDDVPRIFRQKTFKGLDLHEITVNKLQHLLSEGRLTSAEYVFFCLTCIHQVSPPQGQRHCGSLHDVEILKALD